MSQILTQEEVFAAALSLEPKARQSLAEHLWSSLPIGMDSPPLSVAWRAELDRRMAEIDAGTAEFIDAEAVFQDIRERLERK